MEARKGTVLGVVAAVVLVGAAVGFYLWTSGSQAGTVEPGSFNDVGDGVKVGAHAGAIGEPVDVQVEWSQASEHAGFDRLTSIQGADRVAELSIDEEHRQALSAKPGSAFLVALPVPEDVDPEHVTGASFLSTDHVPEGSQEPGFWVHKPGVHDPEAGLFLTSVPILGGSDGPTRLAVVEHADQETRSLPGAVAAAEASLSGSEEAAEPAATAGLSLPGLGTARASTVTEGLRFSSHTDTFTATVSGASGFTLLCEADPCPSPRKLAVHDGLEQGASKWEELAGTDGPSLPEGTYEVQNSALEMDTYEWNLRDAGTQPECPGIYGAWGDTGALTCMDGGSWTQVDGTPIGTLDATERVTAHELFHAYQYGYGAEDRDQLVSEGTARLTETVDTPLELSRVEWPPVVTDSLFEQSPYRAEYLFYHLFQNEGLAFEEFGHLFQRGLTVEALDAFVGERTAHDGLGEAYWPFAKDLAYENRGPRVGPPAFLGGGGECELFEQPDPLPAGTDVGSREPQRDPIDVDEHTVSIDTGTLEVDVGDGSNTIETSLEGLASDVYRFDYRPGATLENGLWVTVTLEAPGSDDPDVRMKLYDEENEGTKECWEDDKEVENLGESAGIEVWEGDEEATLLVSNLEHDRSAGYELVFEAFPMWSQTGNNPQNTYCVGCQSAPSSGGAQTMSVDDPAGASFQVDDEPGSLKWSANSENGISRPTYAYEKVYTVYGQGGVPGALSGLDPSISIDAPEGLIVARDAQTGELVFEASDDGAQLEIGTSAPGGFFSTGKSPLDLSSWQHEAIAGNGHLYVPGTHVEDFYPPGEDPPPGEMLGGYQGVLAFDADDGSLAWEEKPPDNPPHELNHIHQISLDHETLYAKGLHVVLTQGGNFEIEHKIWRVPADGGDFQEVWSAPYTRSKMVMADGQAIVAGWASPAEIKAIDLDTGEVAWSHEDVFSPPPQDEDRDRETYTMDITSLAYDEGTVFAGTTIATEDSVRGAVYAYDAEGRQWRYGTDETSPTPAVKDGTLYAMTGSINVSEEEDPDSPEDAVDQASILHAVDAARNETRWAVNASTTMTVTDDRIYVGKRAPVTDPMGSSVAALDRASGQVVWVNEEDVNGPMAWTGAFVDDVLYVNTQASVVALNG